MLVFEGKSLLVHSEDIFSGPHSAVRSGVCVRERVYITDVVGTSITESHCGDSPSLWGQSAPQRKSCHFRGKTGVVS